MNATTIHMYICTTASAICVSRCTGKERDTESGNDYFGAARYYASSMGRWLSPDPLGMAFADPTDPQSLNHYAYVLNNPLIFFSALHCCTRVALAYIVEERGASLQHALSSV